MSTNEMLRNALGHDPDLPPSRGQATRGPASASGPAAQGNLRLLNEALGANESNVHLSAATITMQNGIVRVEGNAENQGSGRCIGPYVEMFARDGRGANAGHVRVNLPASRLEGGQKSSFVAVASYYGVIELVTVQGFCGATTPAAKK